MNELHSECSYREHVSPTRSLHYLAPSLSHRSLSLSLTLALSFQLSLNVLLPVYFNLFQCECPSPSMHFSLSSPDFGSHIIIIIIAPSLYPPLSPCLSISLSPAISLSPPPSLCPSPSIPISLSLSFLALSNSLPDLPDYCL